MDDTAVRTAAIAAAWVVLGDLILVSAFAAAYAARIVRKWNRNDD